MLSGGSAVYGPFHRLRNPVSQSDTIAAQQQRSQEIWGKAARWSYLRSVKAHNGSLPTNSQGIEFITATMPSRNGPCNVFWDEGAAGVSINNQGFAVISVTITKKVP